MRSTGSKKNLQKSTSDEERREMMDRDYREIPLKKQAQLLNVNRTSAYYCPREKEDTDIELMHRIDEIYTRWPHYGYRRITKELQDQNIPVNRKRVLRLMRRMGIYGICPGPNLSKRNHQHHTYPYLLRGVKAERPDHIWGIDITYIRMKGGFMYLAAIIDWYSRCVVSWELSQSLERSFVLRALKKALAVRKPEIINSDQGSHFTCGDYIELLKENGVKISMDGKGRATDNAITERFFRNLKWEKIYYEEYRKPQDVYRAVRDYIDEYNFVRPHQAIGYEKPANLYFGQARSSKTPLTIA